MAIVQNTAGQGLYVYAYDNTTDLAKTGDSANITATISKDGGGAVATATANPTEISGGVYWYPLSQAETNAKALALIPVSATANVLLSPVFEITIDAAISSRASQASVNALPAAAAAQSAVESALLLGAEAAMADLGNIGLGIAFDLRNPRAVAYLRDKGAALVTQINETTRAEMRDLIVNMIEERASYDQIAREISRRWAEMAIPKPQGHIDSRAHLIAVTEVGNAYEAGNLAAVQDMASLGLAMEKSWLTVGDDRVSDGCAENEGAGWIPLDEPFPSGDQAPLRFPGCRCTALYRRVGSG